MGTLHKNMKTTSLNYYVTPQQKSSTICDAILCNYMQVYSNKYHISLTECNSGTIQKLSIWSWYYDWAQKYDNYIQQ
jgi:hypothetical protein